MSHFANIVLCVLCQAQRMLVMHLLLLITANVFEITLNSKINYGCMLYYDIYNKIDNSVNPRIPELGDFSVYIHKDAIIEL